MTAKCAYCTNEKEVVLTVDVFVCSSMITTSFRRFRSVMSDNSTCAYCTNEKDVVLTDDVFVCSSMITTSFRRFQSEMSDNSTCAYCTNEKDLVLTDDVFLSLCCTFGSLMMVAKAASVKWDRVLLLLDHDYPNKKVLNRCRGKDYLTFIPMFYRR